MAQTLFDGGCVDGDHALAEAACSVRCFVHLAELGLPFPTNRYAPGKHSRPSGMHFVRYEQCSADAQEKAVAAAKAMQEAE